MLRSQKKYSGHFMAFFVTLACAVVIFLPFIIFDRGYFIYYGDFNVQQIPFYKLAHQAVRNGEGLWNWKTDLGVNFIGSYSFYLLFSPFFWLTLLFPTSLVPYLMAPLLILKTACSSLTAFCYLQRFVRDERYAVIGGMLYAFSGWMAFNIFFNHFHDVAVFFPLLLLALERLVHGEGRWGFFAMMVALCCAVNYWFFIGEVVFVIIYFIVRTAYRGWPVTFASLARIAAEALLGVGIAMAALLPSVLALMGNPRTGTSELLNGWNFWRYWNDQQQWAIVWSFFFPPELPARPNFFPDVGAKWSSLSAWLPMLGPVGVMTYFSLKKRDWLKTILGICIVIALIPGLNSIFILLNHSYYARWFYMPILLMSLASIRAIEQGAAEGARFVTMLKWQVLILAAFSVMAGLTPVEGSEGWELGLGEYPEMVLVWFGIALVCVFLTWLIVVKWRRRPDFVYRLGAGVAAVAVVFTVFYMATGKIIYERRDYVINVIEGREGVQLPQEPWARSDAYDASDNLLMFWDLPNIQAFHSIVPPSIMSFYPEIGVKRDVSSKPEASVYALRPLVSVRWLFIEKGKEEQAPMPGYVKYTEQNGFNIYENQNFLPMGFSYDFYITVDMLNKVAESRAANLMLRAIVLEDEALERNADLLWRLPEESTGALNEAGMLEDIENRRQYVATDFKPDRLGFSAKTNFESERILFFSVPYEEGWSAKTNGAPAVIERANLGFMAVRVPAGECEVRFDYVTPGLVTGLYVTAAALLAWFACAFFMNRIYKQRRIVISGQQAKLADTGGVISWDEFLSENNPQQRRERLQRALNEAAVRHIETALPQRERTLSFTLPDEPPKPTAAETEAENNE